MSIRVGAHARIGLLGNPSDGYFGRTIACTIHNFSVEVQLEPSERFTLVPHQTLDPVSFGSIDELRVTAERDGYYGGLRLVYATCKKFVEFCRHHDIALSERNPTIRYETNIPRQVGLAGSSAIITAVVGALREFYGVTDDQIPRHVQPNLVLSVEEEELDIRAGLQDRVAQTYGGLVYMDFDRTLMDERGYGEYEPIRPDVMPPLFLAYLGKPKDSGQVHSDVRARWHQGDSEVIDGMSELADLASRGKESLMEGDLDTFSELMDRNFDVRLRMFGEEVIGAENMEMIGIARGLGVPAKFSGSGGAVVGMWRSRDQLAELKQAYGDKGYAFTEVAMVGGDEAVS
jgi:glucuronokinase